MDAKIRLAKPTDAAGIKGVYTPFVERTAITFELQPPTVKEMERRIQMLGRDYPYLVCEVDGKIVAYAHGSNHQRHTAYCYNADATIYIEKGSHGRGIGAALYDSLLSLMQLLGLHTIYAGITVGNDRSIAFHTAQGFRDVAFYPKDGYKLGKWQDVVWMAKCLLPYESNPKPIKVMADLDEKQIQDVLKRAAAYLK